MAYAQQPDDMKAPPPYSSGGMGNPGVAYPGQQQYHGSPMAPPPPIPVYTQTTTIVTPMVSFLGRHPQGMQCPNCRQQIITMVNYEVGGGAWLFAFLICIFGGIFGCCLIPFCVSSCQDAVHACPSCRAYIGRRNII